MENEEILNCRECSPKGVSLKSNERSKNNKIDKETMLYRRDDISSVPFDAEFFEIFQRVSFESKTLFDFFAGLQNKIDELQKYIYNFKYSSGILTQKEKEERSRKWRYLIFK